MTARTQHPSRRRRWVVNRPLQLQVVRAMVLVLCVMAVLAIAAVYAAVWITLSSFELTRDPLIGSLLRCICWTIVLELLVLTPLVIWWGIRLTHRIAGPLLRIHAALQQLAAGRVDQHILLRKGDFFTDIAAAINALAESLRTRRR